MFSERSRQQHGHSKSRAVRLARRAKSFKEDFLDKLNQKIRSPSSTRSSSPQHSSSNGTSNRSTSSSSSLSSCNSSTIQPNNNHKTKKLSPSDCGHSPKLTRGTPIKLKSPTVLKQERDVENSWQFVKQLNIALRYVKDVVDKDKLEQLPGAASILLEIVVNGYNELRAVLISNEQSSLLLSATNQVYQSLANLIRWSDVILMFGYDALDREALNQNVKSVQDSAKALVQLCVDRYQNKEAKSPTSPKPETSVNETSGHSSFSLSPSTTTISQSPPSSPLMSTSSHRKSLPDIPSPNEHKVADYFNPAKDLPAPFIFDSLHHSISSDSILSSQNDTQYSRITRGSGSIPPPKPPLPDVPDGRPLSVSDFSNEVPPPLPPKQRTRRALLSQASFDCHKSSFYGSNASSIESLLNLSSRFSADDLLSASRMEDSYDNHQYQSHVRYDSFANVQRTLPFNLEKNAMHKEHRYTETHHNCDHLSTTYSTGLPSPKCLNGNQQKSHSECSSPVTPYPPETRVNKINELISKMKGFDVNIMAFGGKPQSPGTPPDLPVKLRSKVAPNIKINNDFIRINGTGSLQNAIDNETHRPPSQYDNIPCDFGNNLSPSCPSQTTKQDPIWLSSNHSVSCPHYLSRHASALANNLNSSNCDKSDILDGKPPPLPPKKRNIMAYMQMVGSYDGPNKEELNLYPDSVYNRLIQTQSQTWQQVEVSFLQQKSITTSFISATGSDDSVFSLDMSSYSPYNSSYNGHDSFHGRISDTSIPRNGTDAISMPPMLPPKKKKNSFSLSTKKEVLPSENRPQTSSPISLGPSSESGISSQSELNKVGREEITQFGPIDEIDVGIYLVHKNDSEDGFEIRGGPVDALVVKATEVSKNDFLFQEAFLTTYRTFITPMDLIDKLLYRYNKFIHASDKRQKAAKSAFALLVRLVDDLCVSDCDDIVMQTLLEFVYQLVCRGDLALARVLRTKVMEKFEVKKIAISNNVAVLLPSMGVTLKSCSLLDCKSENIAEQMTLLDSELFQKIEIPEVLIWAKEQKEELIPNLNRFTEHFNKMSYWTRSRILEEEDAKDREKLVMKFIKIMKFLRKLNNFNSYLAILSALDSAPIRRLEWQKTITEGLKEYCALIDSTSSFRAYRHALAETQPPCIPYIGLILQDLTFVHIGNHDFFEDGNVNFAKRWQQFNILDQMRRFKNCHYVFKRSEQIISFFNNFDNYLSEEAMWQISESIKPRGGTKL